MKLRFSSYILAVLIALSACNTVPVEDMKQDFVTVPDGVTIEKMEEAILTAGRFSDWHVTVVEPGQALARTTVRGKHSVSVDILFNTEGFTVKYRDSQNLKYDGETIHEMYNIWVRELTLVIERELRLIGITRLHISPPVGPKNSHDLLARQ